MASTRDRVSRPVRVWVVGLGTIAQTHLEVLGNRPDAEVVLGVDPAPGRPVTFPVHPSWEAALGAADAPDVVVVATPSDLHVPVVEEVLATTDARVLCEKPLARRDIELARLRERHTDGELADRVRVAHHFAYSPEVRWASGVVAAHPEWGAPTSVVSVFNDPYSQRPADLLSSYVTAWVDSGPNQLSMLSRFVAGWEVLNHTADAAGHRSVTDLAYAGGRASLVVNWVAGDSSKQTSLTFAGGAEVRLDHTAMTGLVLLGGGVVEHLGYAGRVGRKAAHYRGVYDDVLSGAPSRFSSFELAAEIAQLLDTGGRRSTGRAAALAWSESCSIGE